MSADTTNIALRGTGGIGRQEFSTLTVEVRDTAGHAVAGAVVDFAFSDAGPANFALTTGGLTLLPSSATSDANGTAATVVSAGTIPTSVRVIAFVHGSSPSITSLSNVLVISTGVPDQKHFSLSTKTGNCEGGNFDQTCSIVTATLGDHFGNPVPDGTAVNFTTEGGIIDAACVTGSLPPSGATTPVDQTTNSKVGPGSGTCSVTLRASSPRPADGRVTVLAYALGEEDFFDANGNNVCDLCDTTTGSEFTPSSDKSPDVFRDDNEDGVWNPGEPCVGPNSNALCSTGGDGKYNGVLRIPRSQGAQTLYVSKQLVQTFSGSTARITFSPSTLTCTAGQSLDVQVRITDGVGNVMPAGTLIGFSTFGASGTVTPSILTVGNFVFAVGGSPLATTTPYTATVACPSAGGTGKLIATVATPNGVVSTASISIN